MPKMKSNSGAKKRFRKTGKGKWKFKRAYKNHILTHKTTKQKRRLRGTKIAADCHDEQIKQMLPYL